MSIRGFVRREATPKPPIRPQPWTCGGLRPYPADRLAGNRIILFSRNLEFEGDDYGKPYECASPGGGLVCAVGDSIGTDSARRFDPYVLQPGGLPKLSVPIASTETFDEFQPDSDIGVGIVTLDEVTYASSTLSAIWRVSDTFVAPSPPNSLVQRNVIAPATLTFGEGEYQRCDRLLPSRRRWDPRSYVSH